MSWWKCCCAECLIYQDDFTRDIDGTPLRRSWCDKSGDYYIVNTPTWRARCEVPNAIAVLNVKQPDQVGSMYVECFTQDEQPRTAYSGPGQKWRLYVNMRRTTSGTPVECSATSYYFAEYERLGGGLALDDRSWIRLGIGSAGTETFLKQVQFEAIETGLSRRFWCAIDDDTFCAGVTEAVLGSAFMKSPGLFTTLQPWYSGFSMSEKDMLLDDYAFYRHYNSKPPQTRDLNCPRCGLCLCDDNTSYGTDEPIELPPVLNVCIWPDPYGCARLENLEPCCFEIEYDRVNADWRHDGNKCCGAFKVVFGCLSGGGTGLEKYFLANMAGCTQSGEGPSSRHPIEHKCSSESGEGCFLFGPYWIADSDFACQCRNVYFGTGACSYYITVSTNACCSRKSCNEL